jgi:hypothetical protein
MGHAEGRRWFFASRAKKTNPSRPALSSLGSSTRWHLLQLAEFPQFAAPSFPAPWSGPVFDRAIGRKSAFRGTAAPPMDAPFPGLRDGREITSIRGSVRKIRPIFCFSLRFSQSFPVFDQADGRNNDFRRMAVLPLDAPRPGLHRVPKITPMRASVRKMQPLFYFLAAFCQSTVQ